MSKSFKVIQSNPNSSNGFVTKMQCETVVPDAIFGDKVKKETYYISGSKQLAVDTEIPHAAIFPKYKVVEHPGINPSTNEEITLKWLHLA